MGPAPRRTGQTKGTVPSDVYTRCSHPIQPPPNEPRTESIQQQSNIDSPGGGLNQSLPQPRSDRIRTNLIELSAYLRAGITDFICHTVEVFVTSMEQFEALCRGQNQTGAIRHFDQGPRSDLGGVEGAFPRTGGGPFDRRWLDLNHGHSLRLQNELETNPL